MANESFRHIILDSPPKIQDYTSTSSGGRNPNIPPRDRLPHSQFLQKQLIKAWDDAENEQAVAQVDRKGVYLEFKSDPGFDLITKSLEDMRSKEHQVRLLNVREATELVENPETGEEEERITTYATVFVPHEKKGHFLNKLRAYEKENVEKSQKPKNADLVNSIGDVYKASLVKDFWQDRPELVPKDDPEWCEVWLSSDSTEVIERFEVLLKKHNIESGQGTILFPERAVKIILATQKQLEMISIESDDIAEYRRAKETAAFWADMENKEQAEWVDDLLGRIQKGDQTDIAVCILDTGVNNGHPLIKPVLEDIDCQAVDPAWGEYDHHGHGTLMAGLTAYGDLAGALRNTGPVPVHHCLESSKILPVPPDENKPELWGFITYQGTNLPEIQAPERKRIFCMAVTATDTRDRGRPSSWSGALDQICSGRDDNYKRLFFVCAGNYRDTQEFVNYPDVQITESIHDPAQSWNAMTIGAYTELVDIQDPTYEGYEPVAPRGGLSPFSTTTPTWDHKWPIKPEILMEGGNAACDDSGFVTECDDLSLLSTFWQPTTKMFSPFNMTSAATAQASWFAAQILYEYPDIWPETIRALMVHSAEWTEILRRQFLQDEKKSSYYKMLKICGYGVPNLGKALHSAANSVTLISQAELQPFNKKENGSGFRTKDMHFYDLPWPKEILLDLPDDVHVEMRVTLSYFIEPGPGEIGWKDRYRYASHGLRFDVKSPQESQNDFMKRINTAVREEDEGHPGTASATDHWVIGPNGRNKGSIHSDIWKGTAAELAESGGVAVYPVIGWWRERSHLGCWDKKARYSLVVSINTPSEDVDVYTPVAAQVGITVPVTIET